MQIFVMLKHVAHLLSIVVEGVERMKLDFTQEV